MKDSNFSRKQDTNYILVKQYLKEQKIKMKLFNSFLFRILLFYKMLLKKNLVIQ